MNASVWLAGYFKQFNLACDLLHDARTGFGQQAQKRSGGHSEQIQILLRSKHGGIHCQVLRVQMS